MIGRAVVVDASVAAKWLLPASGSAAAARILEEEGIVFHVPELFDAELASVLWKRARRGELTADDATLLGRLIGEVPARRHRHAPLLEGALALALELSITPYDALYVALAAALDARLITADAWLAERAARSAEIQLLTA